MRIFSTSVLVSALACLGVLAVAYATPHDKKLGHAPPEEQSPGVAAPAPFQLDKLAPKKDRYDTPTIACGNTTDHTIFLQVCAGPSGAPAGFSVQWVPLPDVDGDGDIDDADCAAFVWPLSDDPGLCKASFSGTPGCSVYNLRPNACVTVEIGNLNDAECGVGLSNCGADELECGTRYVFRAFAHADSKAKRSDFTANLCCDTEPCEGACTLTQGFWKTHPCDWCGFNPGDNGTADPNSQCALTGNPDQQCACDPNQTLTIGCTGYTQCQLLCALDRPGQGNALVILAHQLIAAKLNLCNGTPDCTLSDPDNPGNPYNGKTVSAIISEADSLICSGSDSDGTYSCGINPQCCTLGNIDTNGCVPPGGRDNTLGPRMTAAARLLDLYNNGDIEGTGGCAEHCEE